MAEVECIWPLEATLGEGPVWVAREQALWFTDIKQRRIHRFDPASGAKQSWDAPDQPGFILPASGGRFIAGLKTGLHFFDPATGAFDHIVSPEPEWPGNRLNDATVGPDGRLWFGSMDDDEEAECGAVHRLDPDGQTVRVGGECCITNGPAISPDGRTLYHTDTLGRSIDRFDIAADGTLANRRRFATIDAADGYPDGPIVDSEGCLWTGLWGGWRARRYSPSGEILTEVLLPAANITKLALGGPDLRTAFVTSARKGLSDDELEAQPLAGGLFSFRVDVPGLPVPEISIGV
jgi:xylono-1,5-lactonase